MVFPVIGVTYSGFGLYIVEPGVLHSLARRPNVFAGNRTGVTTDTFIEVQNHADLRSYEMGEKYNIGATDIMSAFQNQIFSDEQENKKILQDKLDDIGNIVDERNRQVAAENQQKISIEAIYSGTFRAKGIFSVSICSRNSASEAIASFKSAVASIRTASIDCAPIFETKHVESRNTKMRIFT